MKKIENLVSMSAKELRQVAKGLEIAGRWDMNKTQLIEAVEKRIAEAEKNEVVEAESETKVEAEVETEVKAEAKEGKQVASKKSNAMKVQRAFIEVGEYRNKVYRYITITVKNASETQAAKYIEDVCVKMNEMDDEFHSEYEACRCPDFNEETKSYTDMIFFKKAAGQIATQRRYVGKLMTRAMAALKESD